ncbi:VOC family protein [Parachitinimonas caeni]|uniref:VOC family protein n=1 Tax=Parachitinimonas caeni TaxID=3031301 RepID=A0ABT7E071_9NEIS|nr:VOC family protein [Parachitinimonas caeni]MDK2125704.1 VOC family protein [Parachitinimonas caeni]
MQVQPYLIFNGRCAEAIEFYKKAVDAQILFQMQYKDAPDQAHVPPGSGEKMMHVSFKIGESVLMAADGQEDAPAAMEGCSLSISVETTTDADRVFQALAAGGTITMPLTKTFWSEAFGMLVDKFGISWMINVEH